MKILVQFIPICPVWEKKTMRSFFLSLAAILNFRTVEIQLVLCHTYSYLFVNKLLFIDLMK